MIAIKIIPEPFSKPSGTTGLAEVAAAPWETKCSRVPGAPCLSFEREARPRPSCGRKLELPGAAKLGPDSRVDVDERCLGRRQICLTSACGDERPQRCRIGRPQADGIHGDVIPSSKSDRRLQPGVTAQVCTVGEQDESPTGSRSTGELARTQRDRVVESGALVSIDAECSQRDVCVDRRALEPRQRFSRAPEGDDLDLIRLPLLSKPTQCRDGRGERASRPSSASGQLRERSRAALRDSSRSSRPAAARRPRERAGFPREAPRPGPGQVDSGTYRPDESPPPPTPAPRQAPLGERPRWKRRGVSS